MIVVLTDGEDTSEAAAGDAAFNELVAMLMQIAGPLKIRLFVLTIGPLRNTDRIGEICKRGRGKHIPIALGAQNIARAFKQVAAFLGQATLEHL
jgi:hypothetical protein